MYFFKDAEEEEKETTKVMARSALAKLALKNRLPNTVELYRMYLV